MRDRGRPGDELALVFRKPVYLPEARTITVSKRGGAVPVDLAEVTQFAGRWRLANGELRELERNGDRVDVFEVTEARGGAHVRALRVRGCEAI
jgi:hypothetical protein